MDNLFGKIQLGRPRLKKEVCTMIDSIPYNRFESDCEEDMEKSLFYRWP